MPQKDSKRLKRFSKFTRKTNRKSFVEWRKVYSTIFPLMRGEKKLLTWRYFAADSRTTSNSSFFLIKVLRPDSRSCEYGNRANDSSFVAVDLTLQWTERNWFSPIWITHRKCSDAIIDHWKFLTNQPLIMKPIQNEENCPLTKILLYYHWYFPFSIKRATCDVCCKFKNICIFSPNIICQKIFFANIYIEYGWWSLGDTLQHTNAPNIVDILHIRWMKSKNTRAHTKKGQRIEQTLKIKCIAMLNFKTRRRKKRFRSVWWL